MPKGGPTEKGEEVCCIRARKVPQLSLKKYRRRKPELCYKLACCMNTAPPPSRQNKIRQNVGEKFYLKRKNGQKPPSLRVCGARWEDPSSDGFPTKMDR